MGRGTGWDHRGPCRACGGTTNHACGANQLCLFPDADPCGETGAPGLCRLRSTECSLADAPVCGCDGRMYRNTCDAHAIGVNVCRMGSYG